MTKVIILFILAFANTVTASASFWLLATGIGDFLRGDLAVVVTLGLVAFFVHQVANLGLALSILTR